MKCGLFDELYVSVLNIFFAESHRLEKQAAGETGRQPQLNWKPNSTKHMCWEVPCRYPRWHQHTPTLNPVTLTLGAWLLPVGCLVSGYNSTKVLQPYGMDTLGDSNTFIIHLYPGFSYKIPFYNSFCFCSDRSVSHKSIVLIFLKILLWQKVLFLLFFLGLIFFSLTFCPALKPANC